MTKRSFSSTVAELNKAQTEAVKMMGFASFLRVDLKQISRKFSKWLAKDCNPYAVSFRLPYGQKFLVIAFDVYLTLGVPIGGTQTIEINKSSINEEYKDVTLRNHYYNKSILKYIGDVNQIASLDWCLFILDKLIISVMHYKEKGCRRGGFQWCTILLDEDDDGGSSCGPTLTLGQLESEARMPASMSMADSSIGVDREEHREVGTEPDNQSLVPASTSVPNPNTTREKDNDDEDDDDGAH
ncbi:hypothetical protein Cgig2_019183 [Carnegiea gigantea]|uniref:Uncharacterized protein n=1 Tax=Carnegiea gigantea TaxID=171969 RepID=A0A9Q1Q8Z6_9CARY|nr:hypothetical protein Cgig2_019183 [Carnegiea gigantea]